MSSPLTLIAADIGNVNTKYRRQGGAWEIEPSLVRLFSTRMGYEFTSDTPVQPFVYVSGPAGIEANVPYLIGRDAQRAGVSDVALIGSAELRVHSAAYLLLHLYAIVASLPAGQTQAHIAFAGGLPDWTISLAVVRDGRPVAAALAEPDMGRMLSGDVSWKNLSGPVTIADYAGQSAMMGWLPYLNFLALISISLGVLNLLPVPVLDGGQLMYYMAEILKGSPVSERVMQIGQQVGLALLLGLTAFAFYNDIHRLLTG